MEESYKEHFRCESRSFPFKYLGIPIHFRKLKNGKYKPMEEVGLLDSKITFIR
jgi:hypothetical protein